MNFSIRSATERDYKEIEMLFAEIDTYHRESLPLVFRKPDGPSRTQDFLFGVLNDRNAMIFIAEYQGRIIGLVHAYVREIPEIPIRIPCQVGEVDQIIVTQRYRHYGVGKALMERVHQWAGEMKLDRLELSVWDFNQGAHGFYRDLGYVPAFHRMWKSRPFPQSPEHDPKQGV